MLGDVFGINLFNFLISEFILIKGLIFIDILFVDEINWILFKIQVVLFEVMQECKVMIDGDIYEFNDWFMVIVIQNLIE